MSGGNVLVEEPWTVCFVVFMPLAELSLYYDFFYAHEEMCDEWFTECFVVILDIELEILY